MLVVALAVVLIARGGGGGSSDGGSGAEGLSHKVLPQPKAKAPARRRSRPAGPHGAGWSVFEDHTALVRDGPARRQQTLDELKTLGADTLRVEVKWNEVAPSPARARRPRFDSADPSRYPGFAAYDDLFRRAASMGFRVIADLAPDAPRWATAGGHGYAATANLNVRPADFGSFAGAVAKRYSGAYRGLPRVVLFSVWNEPNHSLFMKPVDQGPDRYRAMVRAAVPAIRAGAAAGTRVLVGETAPAGRPGTSLGPREFMQRFLCLDTGWRPVTTGACAGFGRLAVDGWAHHPYGPVDVVPAGRDIVNMLAIRRLGAYLDHAAAAGRLPRRLPIYDTEFGLQSNPPDPTVTTSLAKQAEQLNEKEELSWRYPRLRSYAQYLLWDDPQRPGPRDVAWSGFQTGLRFGQGPAKPAWNAYRLPLVVHRGGRGVRIWGRVRPGNGRRSVQLSVRGSTGWRDAGRPLKTDAAGFFTAGRRVVGAYRFRAAGVGLSRVAEPVG